MNPCADAPPFYSPERFSPAPPSGVGEPVELLSAAERERLSRFPDEISPEGLAGHFALTEEDLAVVRSLYGEASQLGFAIQPAALRYLGFVPSGLRDAPVEAIRARGEGVKSAS